MSDHYLERINTVIDPVVSHLDEPLPLERLARLAHFSPFHFHRICEAVVGETVEGRIPVRPL